MDNFEHHVELVVSASRAMLGQIYPEIRAISVGIIANKLFIKCYLDRPVNEDDYENLNEISAMILGDFPEIDKTDEVCEYNMSRFKDLDHLSRFVYIRKEF
jgi:hypothetical protein